MGMPIVDLAAPYSYASIHPVLAALIILLLIALAAFLFWVSRKLSARKGTVRLVMFVAYLVLTVPTLWAAFKPHPAPLAQAFEAALRLHQATEKVDQYIHEMEMRAQQANGDAQIGHFSPRQSDLKN